MVTISKVALLTYLGNFHFVPIVPENGFDKKQTEAPQFSFSTQWLLWGYLR